MSDVGRRKRILSAAGQLFAEQGVAGTTVRQIASKADLLSGSLYYYFPSKESIAAEILTEFLSDLNRLYLLLECHGAPAPEQLLELVCTSFRVAADHPYATEIYHNERPVFAGFPDADAIVGQRDTAQAAWQRIIERGVAAGSFRADVAPNHFQRMLSELVWLTTVWHRPTLKVTADQLADELVSVFLQGFSAPSSRSVEHDVEPGSR